MGWIEAEARTTTSCRVPGVFSREKLSPEMNRRASLVASLVPNDRSSFVMPDALPMKTLNVSIGSARSSLRDK